MSDADNQPGEPRSGLAAIGRGTIRTDAASKDVAAANSAAAKREAVGQPTPTASTGVSATRRDPSEPVWTTGQGIGFLVALPGWLLAPVGLLGALITAGNGNGIVPAIFAASAVLGLIVAIPGSIVFGKCRRPEGRPPGR